MNVAGEEGDVNEETIASWQERAREIMRGLDGPVLFKFSKYTQCTLFCDCLWYLNRCTACGNSTHNIAESYVNHDY